MTIISIDKVSEKPVYTQIADNLEKIISRDNLSPGTPLSSVQNIAESAGVSLRTAERGLNELVKRGICFRRPKRGTFVGKAVSVKTQCIAALCHPLGHNSFEKDIVQSLIFRGISAAASDKQTDIVYLQADPENSLNFYRSHHDITLSGVLMLGWNDYHSAAALLKKFPQIRFIFVNYLLPNFSALPENAYAVLNDDFTGGYRIASYLAARGCRTFTCLITDLPDENYRERLRGFKQGLCDNNLSISEKNILTVTLREGVSQEDLAGQVLAQTLPCDGVFCVNDLLAAGAAKILKLKNPNSTVIVTGYDNIYGHLSSEYGFTTMSVDFVRMGETALNYLTGSVSGPRIIRIEPQIIIKENNQN